MCLEGCRNFATQLFINMDIRLGEKMARVTTLPPSVVVAPQLNPKVHGSLRSLTP